MFFTRHSKEPPFSAWQTGHWHCKYCDLTAGNRMEFGLYHSQRNIGRYRVEGVFPVEHRRRVNQFLSWRLEKNSFFSGAKCARDGLEIPHSFRISVRCIRLDCPLLNRSTANQNGIPNSESRYPTGFTPVVQCLRTTKLQPADTGSPTSSAKALHHRGKLGGVDCLLIAEPRL